MAGAYRTGGRGGGVRVQVYMALVLGYPSLWIGAFAGGVFLFARQRRKLNVYSANVGRYAQRVCSFAGF